MSSSPTLSSSVGKGLGEPGWCEPEAGRPGGEGGFKDGEDRVSPKLSVTSVVTHMIPLFWAIGVQDRADRV